MTDFGEVVGKSDERAHGFQAFPPHAREDIPAKRRVDV
jgi:hypothetical protein